MGQHSQTNPQSEGLAVSEVEFEYTPPRGLVLQALTSQLLERRRQEACRLMACQSYTVGFKTSLGRQLNETFLDSKSKRRLGDTAQCWSARPAYALVNALYLVPSMEKGKKRKEEREG